MAATPWTEQTAPYQGWADYAPQQVQRYALFGAWPMRGGAEAVLSPAWAEASVSAASYTEGSVSATTWTEVSG